MLMASDNGKTHTFTVNGDHFSLGIISGGCTDGWHTWHGYSALAFMLIRNDFPKAISSVVLSYQVATGTACSPWACTQGHASTRWTTRAPSRHMVAGT
jgi:hypothetical protein